jgi:hypothetical protein
MDKALPASTATLFEAAMLAPMTVKPQDRRSDVNLNDIH